MPTGETSGDLRGPTRREFARTIAGLAAAPLLPGCAAVGAGDPRPAPAPGTAVAAAPPGADELPETEILLRLVRQRYGDHLALDQLEAIRLGIEGGLRGAERLRRIRLANGVAPDLAACLPEG